MTEAPAINSFFSGLAPSIRQAKFRLVAFVICAVIFNILLLISLKSSPTIRLPLCQTESSTSTIPAHENSTSPIHSAKDLSAEDLIALLFRESLHPIIGPSFVADDGKVYALEEEPLWSNPLGQEICIFDTDNRPFSNEAQPFAPGHFEFDTLKDHSAGIFNHYLYALIHGYRYNYIHAPPYPGPRKAYWSKIPAISDMLLDGCRIVIAIDHDALFWNLNLPFEWLLNRWGFTNQTSFAMALDNNWQQNHDDYDVLNINAGFIVAQNLPRTHDILRAWDSCPSNETVYPNCRKFIDGWPAEQGAWGTFMRRQFDEPTDRIEIPCTDANGFPGMGTECFGLFVRHFTIDKSRITPGVSSTLSQAFYSLLRKGMMRDESKLRVLRDSNDFTKSFSYKGGGAHGDPVPVPKEDKDSGADNARKWKWKWKW